MAIRIKLDYMLLNRRLTLTELADRVGITLANLSVHKTNKARAIRFSTLDALCRALDCQPGELLEWTRDEDASGPRSATDEATSDVA
jgi:putative transcriptional regulator